MRWKRRRLLWRSFRSRHNLKSIADRTKAIRREDVLLCMVVRNEAGRLPFFLRHYRDLGIGHFLVIDNGSTDKTPALLADQGDISVWHTGAGYRAARFGVDWLTAVQIAHCHGHWTLSVDADELLIYPEQDRWQLPQLCAALGMQGRDAYGALMLDLYPKGRIGSGSHTADKAPWETLNWFDPGPFRARHQYPLGNLWVQGGARERAFFANAPRRSPTLNKIPLVRWNRRFAYVNSTHSALPPRLNTAYDGPNGQAPSGVLLHSKFLPEVVEKSAEEAQRGEHFTQPENFQEYYNRIARRPELWSEKSVRFEGIDQMVGLGLARPLAANA